MPDWIPSRYTFFWSNTIEKDRVDTELVAKRPSFFSRANLF
jgi:hypothetical protein